MPYTPSPVSLPGFLSVTPDRLQDQADVAALADGGYVVVWRDQTTGPGAANIVQQRFDAAGDPVGAPQVIGASGVPTSAPVVTALADGGWTVFWRDTGYDGRRYGADGIEIDSSRTAILSGGAGGLPDGGLVLTATLVDTDLLGTDAYGGDGNLFGNGTVTVAALADGGFAMAFDYDSGPTREEEIAQIRYGATTDPAPAALLAPWEVIQGGNGTQFGLERDERQQQPDMAGLTDGSRVMVWRATDDDDFSPQGIRAQRIGADDALLGGTFEIAPANTGRTPTDPRIIALSNGGFVVAWHELIEGDAGNLSDIYARVYAADGTPANAGFQVNGITFSSQAFVSLAALEDGGFVAVWQQFDQGDQNWEIWGRLFTADGTARNAAFDGGNFRIDTADNFSATAPEVTALAGGGFTVVWTTQTAEVLGGTRDTDIAVRSFGPPSDASLATPGPDLLIGAAGDDTIDGLAGNDTIEGRAGDDSLLGGAGNDLILGGDQFDTVYAGAGDDTVAGGNGRDLVFLNQGNDLYNDNAQGGELGRDTVFAGFGDDTIQGGNGDDVFYGEGGADLIFGRLGNDLILGGDQFDTVYAGAGDDTVAGGNGRDLVFLNQGNDVYNDNAQGGELGRDTVFAGFGDDTIQGGNGNDVFHGQDGADVIQGRLGDDLIFGGAGNDMIFAGEDSDTIVGGDGNDTMNGGLQSDSLTGGAGADTFVFTGSHLSSGEDTITDFTLGTDVLQITGLTAGDVQVVVNTASEAFVLLGSVSAIVLRSDGDLSGFDTGDIIFT